MKFSAFLPGFFLGLLASGLAVAETDWVLVLDRSESMIQNDPRGFRFDAQKIMVDLLSQAVEELNRLTLIRFAGSPEVVLEREAIVPEKLAALRSTISSDPPQGDTDIGAALALARKTVKPDGRASDVHLILLTDGVQAGKIPNLFGRLEGEMKAYRDLGLPIHTILLNDFSLPAHEQAERRQKMLYYDDKQLQRGEQILRDLAQKTGGTSAQVRPDHQIEDILLAIIGPYVPFHREPISRRIETLPTDRQLLLLLDKKKENLKLRLGATNLSFSLTRPQEIGGDFKVTVSPYTNRTLVLLRPAPDVRWPEAVEMIPGGSGDLVPGDAFVASNVCLSVVSGLENGRKVAWRQGVGPEGLKTRVRQNEVYPLRFEVSMASDISSERSSFIRGVLEKCVIHLETVDENGSTYQVSDLPATDSNPRKENRLYFVPTAPPGSRWRRDQPFSITVHASLQLGEAKARRPIARASNRTFVVTPSPFELVVRKRWQGEAESTACSALESNLELSVGEEARFEVLHGGGEALAGVEVLGSFGKEGEAAAKRLSFTPSGSAPPALITEWVLPPSPGDYRGRVSVKSSTVEEAEFLVHVVRDDFEGIKGLDLGSFFADETVTLARTRAVHRGSVEATARYWETRGSSPLKARLLRKAASGGMTLVREILLAADTPKLGTAEIRVPYRGSVLGLEPGPYLVAWPRTALPGDPPNDSFDRLEIGAAAFSATLLDREGKPLPLEGGRLTFPAGSTIRGKVVPSASFPGGVMVEVAASLAWAGKDAGQTREARGAKEPDGAYAFTFDTDDLHTGPAKLLLRVAWSLSGQDHLVEEDWEIFSQPKALSIALEPISQDLFFGQQNPVLSFRLRAVGGRDVEEQRDLLSVWRSRPASARIENAASFTEVRLDSDGNTLLGRIDLPRLEQGAHELLLSSPVAKLGQDAAACYFKVLPCPFSAKLMKGSSRSAPQRVLEKGAAPATWDAEGAVWATIESESSKLEGAKGNARIVSAELQWNGKKVDSRWSAEENAFSSEALPLDGFESPATVAVSFTDSARRSFELLLGKLEVSPVPIRREASWQKSPPLELDQGCFAVVQGEVEIHGGSRAGRREALEALRAGKAPLLRVTPSSALENMMIRSVEPGGDAAKSSILGDRVVFEAALLATREAKDRILIEVLAGGDCAIEGRSIRTGPASERLLVGRRNQQGDLEPERALPFMAREHVFLRIDGKEGEAAKGCRIQVFPEEEGRAASVPLESVEGRELVWRPKKAGFYLVRAEASLAADLGWKEEEEVSIAAPLELEWSTPDALRMDPGERLPVSIRIRGPASLDWEAFQSWFHLRPRVLAEGGQPLLLDFAPWESDRTAAPGTLLLEAFSKKPLASSWAKAQVILEELAFPEAERAPLDVLDGSIIPGGGSLVIVENFEKGQERYLLRDLVAGFQVAKGSRLRLAYRAGNSSAGVSTESGISARVEAPDGTKSELAVEAVSPGLVVFTPCEAWRDGVYRVEVKMTGSRRLDREFTFEAVRGASDWAYLSAKIFAGAALAGLFLLLSSRCASCYRDRRIVAERIHERRKKALLDLSAEPKEALSGEVQLSLGAQSLGPFPLGGRQSADLVARWVDEHFSMEPSLLADPKKNQKRRSLIQRRLAEARAQLLLGTEKRLPVRAADVCFRSVNEGQGRARTVGEVLHGGLASNSEARKVLLSLRLLDDAKLRISTESGRAVTLSRHEDFHYNGWVGKSGSQIRASVKVPGVPEYCTLTIHWKN